MASFSNCLICVLFISVQYTSIWVNRFFNWYASRNELPLYSDYEVAERLIDKRSPYQQHIAENLLDYYSDFISSFIIEFSSQLVPWWRVVALPATKKLFFANQEKLNKAIERSMSIEPPNEGEFDIENIILAFGHALLAPDGYPYLWFVKHANELLDKSDPMSELFNKDRIKSTNLTDAIKAVSLIHNFYESTVNWGKHNADACSENLAEFLRDFQWFDSPGQPLYRMFCDSPFPNLIVDLLMGLYGHPYHTNVNKQLRLKYTAKSTAMYTDVFILDQARYLYDFLPALPFFKSNIDFPLQMILRVCMDSIGRHAFHGYPYLFHGCSLASIGEEGFRVFRRPDRITI